MNNLTGYKANIKLIKNWQDGNVRRYQFLSTDERFSFVIPVVLDHVSKRYKPLSPSAPHDIELGKTQDKSIVTGQPLGKDYQEGFRRILGILNPAVINKPVANVATATEQQLFELDQFKSKKGPSPLAQKGLPTNLVV